VQGYKPPENESLDAEHLQETEEAGLKRHSKPLTSLRGAQAKLIFEAVPEAVGNASRYGLKGGSVENTALGRKST